MQKFLRVYLTQADDLGRFGDMEMKLESTAAGFSGRQMEGQMVLTLQQCTR